MLFRSWLVDRLGAMEGAGGHEGLVRLVGFTVAALAVLPATLGMGATLPLTVRICATTRTRVGRDVGTIYAVNTLGAILGSFASAFVLVPGFSALARAWFVKGDPQKAVEVQRKAVALDPRLGESLKEYEEALAKRG